MRIHIWIVFGICRPCRYIFGYWKVFKDCTDQNTLKIIFNFAVITPSADVQITLDAMAYAGGVMTKFRVIYIYGVSTDEMISNSLRLSYYAILK